MPNYADAIHAAVRAKVAAWDFPVVTYPAGVRTVGVATVKAATALVQPQTSTFGLPEANRRTEMRARLTWSWRLDLRFDRNVSTEGFEEDIATFPLHVERDPLNGLPDRVTIEIDEVVYEHPPQGQPASGLRAIMTFTARFSPR